MPHARSEAAVAAARDDDTREAEGKRRAVEEVEVLRGSWATGTTTSDAGFLESWVDNYRDCKEDSAAGAECNGGLADKGGVVAPAVHWGDACIRLCREDSMKNYCSSTPCRQELSLVEICRFLDGNGLRSKPVAPTSEVTNGD